MTEKICAVVVTYNRKALLEECVAAIRAQTHPVPEIVVVDNASTDGTCELFEDGRQAPFDTCKYIRLETNGGGAGGFHRGMSEAMKGTADWLWLMDDDTIASPTALAALLEARDRFPAEKKPELLASKVEWVDGTLHGMNFPSIPRAAADPELTFFVAERATIRLRATSFVSALIHRNAIARHGLPYADYFIWNDDMEYTARILREGFGVLVPASVVVHKTPKKHDEFAAAPERSYYQVRNVLWMVLRSSAWAAHERVKIGLLNLRWIVRYLMAKRFSGAAVSSVLRGLVDGLLKSPTR